MEEKDNKLYKLFFKNDNYAVKEVVSTFRKELVLFVNCYIRNIEQSEDIVSDAFVKVILKKPRLKNENYFKTYIYKVAKNLAFDFIKRNKQTVKFCENYNSPLDDELIENEEKELLCKAISNLNKEYRLIIYLKYFREFSIKDISKIVNRNRKYVYNILNRAKNQLKIHLKEVE